MEGELVLEGGRVERSASRPLPPRGKEITDLAVDPDLRLEGPLDLLREASSLTPMKHEALNGSDEVRQTYLDGRDLGSAVRLVSDGASALAKRMRASGQRHWADQKGRERKTDLQKRRWTSWPESPFFA